MLSCLLAARKGSSLRELNIMRETRGSARDVVKKLSGRLGTMERKLGELSRKSKSIWFIFALEDSARRRSRIGEQRLASFP